MSNRKLRNNIQQNSSYLFLIPIFFLLPFFISYIFTQTLIQRSAAVSLDEEAETVGNILTVKDLNDLYRRSNTNKNDIKILGYHQIREYRESDSQKAKLFITSPETFEKEIRYLYENGYKSISLTDYLNYLKFGSLNFIPQKSIVITFDDGYKTQYEKAFPILKKYNFSATFFIYSDCIDKYPVCMDSNQLKDLVFNGMKLANHTTHHIYLPDYTNSLIRKEIEDNNKFLLKLVGTSSVENILAYPLGASDQRIRDIVKDLRYLGAVGVFPEKGVQGVDIYNLPRYLLGNNFDFFVSLFK